MAKLLPIYPNRTEVARILAACKNDRDRMLIELLWATGGRVSEAIRVRVGDITRNGLAMPNLKQGGSAQKHVFLPAPFLDRLRAYCTGKDQTCPIIGHLTNPSRPISRVMAWMIVTHAGAQAGVLKQRYGASELRPPWPHAYRHGNAIHLLDSGVPVNAVSAQLGHAKLQSTAVYLALSDPHREKLVSSVEF